MRRNTETAIVTGICFSLAIAGVLLCDTKEHHSGAHAAAQDDFVERSEEWTAPTNTLPQTMIIPTEPHIVATETAERVIESETIETIAEIVDVADEPVCVPTETFTETFAETETEPETSVAIETVPVSTEISIFSDTELKLLKVASSEAGYTGNSEMMAHIMLTVLNRISSPAFPNSIDEVLAQPEQYDCIYSPLYQSGYIVPEAISALGMIYRGEVANYGEIGYCTKARNQWHSAHMTYLFAVDNAEFYRF